MRTSGKKKKREPESDTAEVLTDEENSEKVAYLDDDAEARLRNSE